MAFERVTTHELREGDVISLHGLRMRLDSGRVTNHPVNEHSPTLAFTGVILGDPRTVDGGAVWRFMGDFLAMARQDDPEGRWVWTVQGNGLAHWLREAA